MYELQMPKFGQTMTEGEIDEWKVQVGDHVEKEQELCIVSTDSKCIFQGIPNARISRCYRLQESPIMNPLYFFT